MAKYDFDKEDVRQHLNMHQDIINRMAANSSSCKAWLVTLLAALTALQITTKELQHFGWIMIVITVMFWYLDAFYLMLERVHRDKEKEFVETLAKDEWQKSIAEKIYRFSTKSEEEHKLKLTWDAMWSTSCKPFYLTLIGLSCIFLWGADVLTWIQSILGVA